MLRLNPLSHPEVGLDLHDPMCFVLRGMGERESLMAPVQLLVGHLACNDFYFSVRGFTLLASQSIIHGWCDMS